MQSKLEELIEYIERKIPLTEEETRILYKVHILNSLERTERKLFKYKLTTPMADFYSNSMASICWQYFKYRVKELIDFKK